MGYEHSKRPIRAPGLHLNSSQSTIGPADVNSGDIAMEGQIKLSTASYTGTDAAQTLGHEGVSFLTYATSGISNDFLLPLPQYPGQTKFIFVVNNTTSIELNINTNATANTFWGTTFNTAALSAASTGGPGGVPAGTVALTLVAHSTTQWAIYPGSTFNWDIAGSTGSTADTAGN